MSNLTRLEQIQALYHLSLGATIKEVADLTGKSESTIERWKRDPKFQEQMAQFNAEALAYVKSRRIMSLRLAMDTVDEIMTSPEARNQDRLKAAELVFTKFDISEALKIERVTAEREIKNIRRESQ